MKVTVYTAPSCMPCAQTKRHLERRSIAYTEVRITSDPNILDAIRYLGHTSAPIVLAAAADGTEQSWDGYRPDRIDQLAQQITAGTN